MAGLIRSTVLSVAVLVAAAGGAWAQPADAPASMLVFDGSGSMWARLEGDKQAKFYFARDALKAALGKANPDARFGMAAFGHRRQGDCADVQVLMAPEGQAGGEKLATLIDKHNPRGKSPLTAALREAAKALPKGSGPRSLIIIHDDLDNCGQDPCAALADIRASAPNVVIHSLGLGLKGDDSQRLQCLVKATGGTLFDVQSANAMPAAAEEVLKLASLATSSSIGSQPSSKPLAPAPKPQPVVAAPVTPVEAKAVGVSRVPLRRDGAPALRLATVLISGAAPTARDVLWSIKPAESASPAATITARGQDVSVPVAAGPYVIEVRDGLAKTALVPVLVAPQGETGVEVPLNAGLLRAMFPASAALGRVQLMDPTDPGQGAILPVGALLAGVPLSPGKWTARLIEGLASRDIPIEVRAGAPVDLGRTWPFARLALTLAGEQTTSRYPSTVILYEDDPDAPRGRREVTRATVGGGDIIVPAGTYAVLVRQGAVEARDRVALQGGETLARTITLAAARITLTSRVPGAASLAPATPGQPVLDAPQSVAYRLERLDVVPAEIFTANRQVAELDVPAGRYRIEARHGLVNARASREVTLTSGQNATITLDQQAGSVRLVGPPGSGSDLLWEILDESSHPLWSTALGSPVATLQAGRYIIRLDQRGKRLERRVEIRTGDHRTVELRE